MGLDRHGLAGVAGELDFEIGDLGAEAVRNARAGAGRGAATDHIDLLPVEVARAFGACRWHRTPFVSDQDARLTLHRRSSAAIGDADRDDAAIDSGAVKPAARGAACAVAGAADDGGCGLSLCHTLQRERRPQGIDGELKVSILNG